MLSMGMQNSHSTLHTIHTFKILTMSFQVNEGHCHIYNIHENNDLSRKKKPKLVSNIEFFIRS